MKKGISGLKKNKTYGLRDVLQLIMVNPFSTNVPLIYPLKIENLWFSDVSMR